MGQVTAYLAPEGLAEQLRGELRNVSDVYGDLFVASGPPQPVVWAQNIWFDPVRLHIESIGDGAKQLKAIQRNWVCAPFQLHRRAKLIQESLPHVSAKPLLFPAPPPASPLGSWTLLDANEILAAARCSSPFPNGEAQFVENHEDPPSRAYLKLWEALTRLGEHPQPGERCLEVGASPGGWTWALAELGASVVAIDRAPLEARVAQRKNVEFRQGDAFAALPENAGEQDWVFSDVACYPEKLLGWVRQWAESGSVRRMVCSVKFQGADHYRVIPEFKKIPGSQLIHLSHNKHELTWLFTAQ